MGYNNLECPHADFRVDVARTAQVGPCPQCDTKCECLDGGHDTGDGVHCMCGGIMPRAL